MPDITKVFEKDIDFERLKRIKDHRCGQENCKVITTIGGQLMFNVTPNLVGNRIEIECNNCGEVYDISKFCTDTNLRAVENALKNKIISKKDFNIKTQLDKIVEIFQSDIDEELYLNWKKSHEKCFDKARVKPLEDYFTFHITPTSMGNFISLTCQFCFTSQSITRLDNF